MKAVEIVYRYGDPGAVARLRPQDADAARSRLVDGNRRFAGLMAEAIDDGAISRRVIQVDARDIGLQADENSAPSQCPFAAILGCSDARVPVELIFNEGPNDLFVVRVAGNGIGSDALGSLRYAIDHLGGSLRLIVALGHSGCGAMSAAVDAFLEPAVYLPLVGDYALRSIVDRLLIVVQASARKLHSVFGSAVTQHPGYRDALRETSIATNAALAASYDAARDRLARSKSAAGSLRGLSAGRSHRLGAHWRNVTIDRPGRGTGEPHRVLRIRGVPGQVGADRIDARIGLTEAGDFRA